MEARMTRTAEINDVETIARCLAQEAQGRIDKKRGFTEVDDFGEALAWLGYVNDAKRLAEGLKASAGSL
jgi:hypothetical protein